MTSVSGRVLMLLENNSYPQDDRVSREARALAAAGYQVSVICPAQPTQPWREVIDGISVYRYPAPREFGGVFGYLWEYGYSLVVVFVLSLIVLLREGFDVIHAHNPPDMFVMLAVFYKLLGKRFVFDHHDLAPELYATRFNSSYKQSVYRTLVGFEKLSCRLADHVIATNQSYKQIQMRRGGVPEHRITIVRNGPDLEHIRPVAPDAVLRGKGKTIIGYGGIMGAQDGVDYLLRALHHLVYELGRTDHFSVIVGKGDALPELKRLATQLKLDQYVWFTGWAETDQYVQYLSSADICVDPDPSNPLNDHSTMIKMMEYMALGKPIVAFDLPEHRFTAQAAAVYVQPNDELEFARALARLMDDPELRREMGAFGRRRVEEELAWNHCAPALLRAYDAIFAQRKSKGLPVIND